MEIKAQLNKPYNEKEKIDFIVEQNHKNGYTIEKTDNALFAWGLSDEELEEKEQERISMLCLTAADVERGIYKAKGMDFDDVISYVESLQKIATAEPCNDAENVIKNESEVLQGLENDAENSCDSTATPQNDSLNIDLKALKIELKANNFYRGNPYVGTIGTLFGFTKTQLDEFFETGDYTKLVATEK